MTWFCCKLCKVLFEDLYLNVILQTNITEVFFFLTLMGIISIVLKLCQDLLIKLNSVKLEYFHTNRVKFSRNCWAMPLTSVGHKQRFDFKGGIGTSSCAQKTEFQCIATLTEQRAAGKHQQEQSFHSLNYLSFMVLAQPKSLCTYTGQRARVSVWS